MLDKWLDTVQQGDCIELMRQLPAESIHFCMFSPPYWGLRDYGIEGQIGLEPTYQEYVKRMVEIGREVKRVLRGDGSWYLNLGDTYAGSWGNYGNRPELTGIEGTQRERTTEFYERKDAPDTKTWPVQRNADVPPKCKLLIPYRVALALIDDGWTCRNDITWYKPNVMPSSVKDRLNCQTERVFHLVKSRKYYYNLDAIREPFSESSIKRISQVLDNQEGGGKQRLYREQNIIPAGGDLKQPAKILKRLKSHIQNGSLTGRNPGDFWTYPTVPSDDYWCPDCKNFVNQKDTKCVRCGTKVVAHFAVYPEALCERPIKSSCPLDGIVLDPMCGLGTTLKVAKRLGRRYIGIDIKPEYVEMTKHGLSQIEWPLDHFAGEEV